MMKKVNYMCNRHSTYKHFFFFYGQGIEIYHSATCSVIDNIGLLSVTARFYIRETEGALTNSPYGPRDLQPTAKAPWTL